MDNSSVLIFKSITSFINDLHLEFGSKFKSISLYHRLLEKTGLVHTNPILKHIECFKTFFNDNKEAMVSTDMTKMVNTKISYSDRVYVDIGLVLKNTDEENSKIIWQHLLTLWGLIDPTSQAKENLKQLTEEKTTENDFLNNIIEKVEKSIDPNQASGNPMEMVSSLMQSGVFNELISGMKGGLENGSLDMSKLMGSVQGMMSKLSPNGQMPPEISNMMSMMGPMLSKMGK